MLTPGELDCGLWVIPEPVTKDKDFSAEENPLQGMIAVMNMEPQIPHVILSVELPFIVVADCVSNAMTVITKIWRTDEKNLREVSKDFVLTFDPMAFSKGEALVRKATEAQKLNKSSDAA